ncbi:MAG TPA: IS1 family transposase [Terriglobia bacterium]|nr:IS1 family transposase [Terriglobia bacterium]
MTCLKCQHSNVRRFGKYGRRHIQRYRCNSCGTTFSEGRANPLGNHYVGLDKATQVLSLLLEGVSIRAASRLTGMHKRTILSLLVSAGHRCQSTLDARVRNLRPRYVELDELWTFVHTKEKNLASDDPADWGDAYTWVALDAETKLVISHLVGKRDSRSANDFIADYSSRAMNRHQVTSDGFKPYVQAIETYFGADIDFAQLMKLYGTPDNAGPEWYGPGKVVQIVPTPVSGHPDKAHICTSHVERSNLSFRMHLRRFTRLVNAFSKKLDNLKAAVTVYVAWYNFCRVHQTLRVTPAMEAGITDHVWEIGELLTANAESRAA